MILSQQILQPTHAERVNIEDISDISPDSIDHENYIDQFMADDNFGNPTIDENSNEQGRVDEEIIAGGVTDNIILDQDIIDLGRADEETIIYDFIVDHGINIDQSQDNIQVILMVDNISIPNCGFHVMQKAIFVCTALSPSDESFSCSDPMCF